MNADGASFCSKCGNELTLKCSQCATPYEAGDGFCSNCGSKLDDGVAATPDDALLRYLPAELLEKLNAARSSHTMAGERRMVTMLFADIQGSTAAAEQLDPEEWADIINGAFERLIRPVYRYEGTLARLMGDAVLAFFGAPIAHEDDPERAIRAGLAMLQEVRPYAAEVEEQWGVAFDLRVGINTGLVVVGEVGSDLRVEYTAIGDAVNVAARMEQAAAPGTLLVSADTQRLVEPLFEFEAMEPIEVKGKSEPVDSFQVTGARDNWVSTRGIPGTTAPLIGRDDEMETLRGVVDEVRAGRGQIATIIGEAGVGKSRLTAALRADLAAIDCIVPWHEGAPSSDHLRWAEARCLSYNTSVAYAPFVDLFSNVFGIGPGDDDRLRRERVVAAVGASGVEDSGRVTTYLCVLLGIPPGGAEQGIVEELPAPALQRRVFSAVVDYLRACSGAGPAMLVIEDLHWADSVSLALLEELLTLTDRSTLGIIVLMRPYREDASWHFHETAQRSFAHRYAPIILEPLGGEAALLLLRELVTDDLAADVEAAILERAQGNPFFVEEIVRNLMESESDGKAPTIPTSVSALLTSRIDRLGSSSKLAVQLGSVFGREFEFGELASLVGDAETTEEALSDLQSRDLIIERSRMPEREYTFRHALIQETAYSTILLKERRTLHAQVAAYLESRAFDPQELARHLIESQQEAKAVPHLLAAAEHAARTMNLLEAIKLYDQVLTWVPADDVKTALRAHDGLGNAYSLIPDLTKAASSYQEMLEVGKERSEPSVQVTALNRLGSATAFLSGDLKKATNFLEQARSLAEEAGDDMGLAEYHMNSCMIATHVGDLEAAAGHDAETARLGDSVGSERVRVGGLVQRAQSLVFAGKFDEGRQALEHARQAAADTTDPNVQANLSGTDVILLLRDGDIAEAWTVARKAAAMASEVGSAAAAVLNLYSGMVATLLGNVEDALTHYAESARLGEELGQLFMTAAASAAMVRIYRDIGIDDEALLTKANEYVSQPMGSMLSSMVHTELGWADLASRDMASAATSFQTGLDGTSAIKVLVAPSLSFGLAMARIAEGDLSGAGPLIEQGARLVDEQGIAFLRPSVAMSQGAARMAAGNHDEAARIFDDGGGLAETMGMAGAAWWLRAARAGALGALGRNGEAEAEASTAREAIEDLASHFVDPTVRDAFLTASLAQVEALAGVPAA